MVASYVKLIANYCFIKVNVDAHVATSYMGLGAVARNHRGEIIWAAVRKFDGVWEVECAEKAAARFGLLVARRLGVTQLIALCLVDFSEALAKFYYFLLASRMAEQEAPFFPREKILERQKYFQSVQKHTYLKGPLDKVTSVAIPIALAATSLFLIGKGIYNMSHGIGKKE
uniref:RNase H type-1 domain-containing protein n=1 Tax=Chenopodium quinoa TaxID=63459 RepID=A0A803MID2_CHEQI